jgi:hypothetical protein
VRCLYTSTLLKGGTPDFTLLAKLTPPAHMEMLTQRKDLAMAHHHFDPLQSQQFLSPVLKFMYRQLVLSNSLSEELEGNSNFNKVLTDDIVRDHLQPAVSLALATNRRLGQRRTWRLPPCIDQSTIRTSVECLADGAWGSLSGSTTMIYLVQRYLYLGTPRVYI